MDKESTSMNIENEIIDGNVQYNAKSGSTNPIGAVWDIFRREDADSIRAFIRSTFKEIDFDDPIHDQAVYLTVEHLQELKMNHGVVGYRVEQRVGNAVFIPAGCPHQVCNYLSCIKIAMDFMYPGNIEHCLKLGEEFRVLSAQHKRKEDLLGPKRMIFYGWQSLKDRVLMINGLKRKKGVVCKKSVSIRGFHKGKIRGSEGLSGDDSDGSFTPKKSKKNPRKM